MRGSILKSNTIYSKERLPRPEKARIPDFGTLQKETRRKGGRRWRNARTKNQSRLVAKVRARGKERVKNRGRNLWVRQILLRFQATRCTDCRRFRRSLCPMPVASLAMCVSPPPVAQATRLFWQALAGRLRALGLDAAASRRPMSQRSIASPSAIAALRSGPCRGRARPHGNSKGAGPALQAAGGAGKAGRDLWLSRARLTV